ncbi:MAG: transcription-repair coupling factor [Pirellulales bacterium]|nr:transcription-repair coupling factor [Pirellulales bacterium]
MAQTAEAAALDRRLFDLVERLSHQADFTEVVAQLTAGHAATLDGVWGSSCALATAAIAPHAPGPLVVVCPFAEDVDGLIDDLALFTPLTPERFPAWEAMLDERVIHDEVFGDRVRVLKLLAGPDGGKGDSHLLCEAPEGPSRQKVTVTFSADAPKLVVTSIQSLLQPVPDRASLAAQTRTLYAGEDLALDDFAQWLVECGFHSTTAVELPGEFSRRGGIVDIFAPDWFDPVRVELFGDQIESIRRFEVSSQRSLATLESVDVTMIDPNGRHRAHLAEHLPASSWILLIEPGDIEEEGRNYLQRLERPEDAHHVSDVLRELLRFPSVTASSVAAGSLEATCRLKIESVERFSGDINKVRDELDSAGAGQNVFVICQTQAEVERLGEVFGETALARQGRLHFRLGTLRAGFRLVSESIALISSSELFHRTDLRRPAQRRLGRVIDSFLELREGDLVVHVAHGIARYRGMKLLEKDEQVEEHLVLEFDGGTRLYVPSTKIGLVQKYIGGTKGRPKLAKLGGSIWERRKTAVQAAVMDMAADMLELQATREAQPGIAFPVDTHWQREFDASFPYNETPDQQTTIEAIKQDMNRPRPMDRLMCGDVGYGKTEVAMRAAFKAIEAGYQVAMLVPTTVLAEQHYRTFTGRMAAFPFEIAVLSRFATRKQQSEIVRRLAEGSIDIVIGTHRLVQSDVAFHNLGLVIIDEEQRFGVEIKERLKALRRTVDVVTTTATPIPRTLHMSLLGLRDISNLQTPPEDRLAIETRVTRFQPDLIRHAVIRELNRNGQIFFVHNRVRDIQVLARKLGQIVPEASIRVGHAQMPEGQLEQVMLDFVDHKFDILLATTIVESGLDIPNANTMFIDEADRYGLADLHQLRGRVGRYKHRAYCYLLVDPNKSLTPGAAKRLRAIEEFSDMGAGFAIAMRDLEIRGAGNILGTQQSGHIATVGYELYCQLLERAVRALKKLPPKTTIDVDVDLPCRAYILRKYVPDMRAKIDLYRRLARVSTHQELKDFIAELHDRFGPPPGPLEQMLTLAGIRIDAQRWGIRSIHLEDKYAVFGYGSGPLIRQLAASARADLRIADGRSAYLPLGGDAGNSDSLLQRVKSLLQSS